MNVKKVILFLLVTAILFPLSAQQGKDVVLVVDTSSSMFSYYNEVGTYLSRLFLAENIAVGDTLHIISFGTKPRFEIARRILGNGDIQTASARIWLLYPFDPSSDPAAAIGYTGQYAHSIQGERFKKVFFVSDSDLGAQVGAAAGRFPPNTELIFIRAGTNMGPGVTVAGQPGLAAVSGTSTAAGSPADSGAGSPTDTGSPAGQDTPFDQADSNQQIPDGTASGGPGAISPVTPEGTADGSLAGGSGFNIQQIPLPLIIGGALLLLLLLAFIIFRMRKLQSSPKKVMAEIRSGDNATRNDADLLNSFASRQAEASLQGPNRHYHYKTSSQFLTNPPMLSIFVEEQNAAIGRRNIHSLKTGATYSVGGGNSDFLIFLVHFPGSIGRLYFDGTNCTFTPLKGEYFPDIGTTPVTECIGKPIRIISRKNYEVFFHFEPYKDPLTEMNQLLNSIKVPEPPSPVRPE